MVAESALLHGAGAETARGPKLAHHFETMEKQVHAARFGVWVFLGSESLLFAALFGAYSVYRTLNQSAFALCSRELNLTLGTANTILLISSSFTVALAGYFIHHDKRAASAWMIFLSILMGFGFLVIKGFEWTADFHEGALPGRYFHLENIPQAGGSQFFSLYFLLTGLHGLHVVVGMGLLAWAMGKVLRREASSSYDLPVEVSGLYWHLVDLIWIFLYPLLYLV
jgi:cytochrome c oxidase subunit 3